MLKYIIIYIIFIINIIKRTSNITFVNFFVNFFNLKIKVVGKKNLQNYGKLKLVIMSNHLNGIDHPIIIHTLNSFTNRQKNIYTIVKHNLLGDEIDNNPISDFFSLFKNNIYNKLNFISYERGNKKDGEKIKNEMLKLLNNNNNILLFPEGNCTRSGIPQDFKPGCFRLCAENNIWILPISLKFNKNIGLNKDDSVNLKKWFNITATVYIHEPVFHHNWEILKNKVLNKIKEPLII
jgi:1-acyl-sn-glycerol-3-phosphate acyltransferase